MKPQKELTFLDSERNREITAGEGEISTDASRVKVLVVPTNEELEIALQTLDCLQALN